MEVPKKQRKKDLIKNKTCLITKPKQMKFTLITLLFIFINSQPKIVPASKNTSPEFSQVSVRDTLQQSKEKTFDTITEKYGQNIEANSDFQWDANQKLEKLLKHYGDNIPDYYGGGFINEKGNLVVNIKGELSKGKAQVIDVIGGENVLFQSKKYSHNELNAIMDYLNEFAQKPENKNYMDNLSAWSQMEDYVEVCFVKMNENSQNEYKNKILNSDAIRFKECGRIRLE